MKPRDQGYFRRTAGRALSLLLLLVFALSAAPQLPGGALQAQARADVAALQPCIARQAPGDDPARLLRDPARFDCHRPAADWGPGYYWLRMALPPQAGAGAGAVPDGHRVLGFVPQWQDSIALFTLDRAGLIEHRVLSDADLPAITRIGGVVGVPLDEEGRGAAVVLLRIDGALNASGLLGNPQLLDHARLDRAELLATAIYAAFAGLGIGLLCYNFVLWLTIRERFQLTYCLSLMAMLAYVWSSSGAMAVQFPSTPHSLRTLTSYVMLAFVAALALQFITDFIEPDKLPRRLRSFARHMGLGCIAAALAVVLVPPEWRYLADRTYVASFVPIPLVVAILAGVAWRRRSSAIQVLTIAWAVPLVMALVRIAHALHWIEFDLVVQYALVVAMSVEALLSSLAMSFRIRLLTDERDRARADERAARHLANVDSLTGLLNRRALLEQVIAWASPEPLRLLIVDIDRFKQINDRHGHLVGDEVLREVAEVLAMRADLRGSVARLGGEEFALVGTADELHEGVALAILADMRARSMAGAVNLTVSIGMAEGPVRSEDEWRELYRRADAALYCAKSEGRNRAVHADSAPAAAATPAAPGPLARPGSASAAA